MCAGLVRRAREGATLVFCSLVVKAGVVWMARRRDMMVTRPLMWMLRKKTFLSAVDSGRNFADFVRVCVC
jgi:hypothetical protein